MVFMKIRTVLQILLQGIILKSLKMLMAKLYLPQGWSQGGWPTLLWAGVGDGNTLGKPAIIKDFWLYLWLTRHFIQINYGK